MSRCRTSRAASATVDETTWVLTSYLVSNAIILPMTGWLANFFGRKRILLLSVFGFTLSSLACGLAPISHAYPLPRHSGSNRRRPATLSQAIMLEAFPPEKRGKAMAFWALGIVVAPMLGPVLGGWITEPTAGVGSSTSTCRSGITATVMAMLFIFDPPYIKRKSEYGRLLGAWACSSLESVRCRSSSIKVRQEDWFYPIFIRCSLFLAIAGLIAFVVRELMTTHPMVDLRVFKNSHVCHRRVHDDDPWLRALWKHGAAAHLASDADGISGAAIRIGDACHAVSVRSCSCRSSAS